MTMDSSDVHSDESVQMLGRSGAAAVVGRVDCRQARVEEGAQGQPWVSACCCGSCKPTRNELVTVEAADAADVETATERPIPCRASRCPSVPSSALLDLDTWGAHLGKQRLEHTLRMSLAWPGMQQQLYLLLPPG